MSKENRVSDERLAEMIAAMENHGAAQLATVYTADYLAALTELQSLRSKPVAGVEVKPLEWVEEFAATWWTADAYRVETAFEGGFSARVAHPQSKAFRTILHGVSLEEAKAACEADYRHRIMSALLPKATAPVVSEPVAGDLMRAIKALAEIAGCFDAAEFEGLSLRLEDAMAADHQPGTLADLVSRRLIPAQEIARSALFTSPQPLPEVTEEGVERAAQSAFRAAQSEYRASHDHFPLKQTWETTDEKIRSGWRGISRAALEAFVKGE